ncbi:hypothetical protein [Sorangium sp. So ce128]|uniref:hypothetical protein n=1 Tax=Sorangium sp. So ce128 TaxID=3133281 RepID=UPI003F630734
MFLVEQPPAKTALPWAMTSNDQFPVDPPPSFDDPAHIASRRSNTMIRGATGILS